MSPLPGVPRHPAHSSAEGDGVGQAPGLVSCGLVTVHSHQVTVGELEANLINRDVVLPSPGSPHPTEHGLAGVRGRGEGGGV